MVGEKVPSLLFVAAFPVAALEPMPLADAAIRIPQAPSAPGAESAANYPPSPRVAD